MSSAAGRLLASLASPRALAIPGYGPAVDALARSRPLPDSVREPLARDLAAAWSERGEPDRGDRVLVAAARRTTDPAASAALSARALSRALDRGSVAADADVRAMASRCLEAADRLLERGDERTPRLLTAAASVTFHRQRHLAGRGSPFATPDGVDAELGPYRESRAWGHLTAPRAEVRPLDALPTRLVVLHDDDDRFVQPLVRQWRAEGLDLRVVGLAETAERSGIALPRTLGDQVAARWQAAQGGPAGPWAALITDAVGDADAVWQEWAQRGAVLASLASPAPVVVRAHSFELFTAFPHLIDPGALTGFVTVSQPLLALARALLPGWAGSGLAEAIAPPTFDPAPFQRPKAASARRTLGLVGWAAPDKDAVWALDVLAALRAADPAWRLRLIGSAPDAQRWPDYAARVADRMARPDVAGAVEVLGQVDNVPAALTGVGVGLSTSLRESYHLGLAEMAASGALPVVRNWPSLAAWGGAGQVWPGPWVVDGVDAAVARVVDGVDAAVARVVDGVDAAVARVVEHKEPEEKPHNGQAMGHVSYPPDFRALWAKGGRSEVR